MDRHADNGAPVSADEIIIVADEWAPYCGRSNFPRPGYGVEIAKKVFDQAGHAVQYRNVPWSRALKETRAGKYNAVIGAYREEAPDFIFPESWIVFFKSMG